MPKRVLQLLERYLLRLRVEVQHTTNWRAIIAAKNRKGKPPEEFAHRGKAPEMRAFMIQMRGTAEALAFCANARGENFA